MTNLPKSMTFTMHLPDVRAQLYLRFHYKDNEGGAEDTDGIELMSQVLDQAAKLPQSLQEVLVKFANLISSIEVEQSPKSK